MCEVLDRIEAKGRAKGREEGKAEERLSLLTTLVKKGLLSIENAAKEVNMTVEEFQAATEQQK